MSARLQKHWMLHLPLSKMITSSVYPLLSFCFSQTAVRPLSFGETYTFIMYTIMHSFVLESLHFNASLNRKYSICFYALHFLDKQHSVLQILLWAFENSVLLKILSVYKMFRMHVWKQLHNKSWCKIRWEILYLPEDSGNSCVTAAKTLNQIHNVLPCI